MSKKVRLMLRDDGYPFMKIMEGRRWIGRVYVDKRGTYRASIAGEEYAIGSTFEDAFRIAAIAYAGRNPKNIVIVNRTSRWWDGPMDEEDPQSRPRREAIPVQEYATPDRVLNALRSGEITVLVGIRKPTRDQERTPAVKPALRKVHNSPKRAQGEVA